jgi:hypothetical protein
LHRMCGLAAPLDGGSRNSLSFELANQRTRQRQKSSSIPITSPSKGEGKSEVRKHWADLTTATTSYIVDSMSRKARSTPAPVSYFRVYDPQVLRKFKIRAVELDRYLGECWEEAIRNWLRKKTYDSAPKNRQYGAPELVGTRIDPDLAQALKIEATKQRRTHGDCLEEAARDWLKKAGTK